MIEGSCHCGAVKFQIADAPKKLVDCNCSICRRVGALWGHLPIPMVKIAAPEQGTTAYVQGAKTLAIHTCKRCGCTTHWENLQPDGEHMAVNFRMCDPTDFTGLAIKRFDGADTWTFLD